MKLDIKVWVVAGLLFSAFHCEVPSTLAEQESKHCANVDWLTTLIEGMNNSTGVSGEVIRYQYKYIMLTPVKAVRIAWPLSIPVPVKCFASLVELPDLIRAPTLPIRPRAKR